MIFKFIWSFDELTHLGEKCCENGTVVLRENPQGVVFFFFKLKVIHARVNGLLFEKNHVRVITALISKIISAKTRKYKTNLLSKIHSRVITA